MTSTTIGERTTSIRRFALFDYGFRPFFLAAGVYALVIVPIWLYFYAHRAVPFGGLPVMYWHAHEMIFGFVAAAIAGFLLTAVPSWTGTRGFAGVPLYIAVGLWAAGRIATANTGTVPLWLVAGTELLFLPYLIALLAPPLMRSRNRNTPLLAVLGVLWLIDAAFMRALGQGDVPLANRAFGLAIDFIMVLVTIIGGRIVPAFTANALRLRGALPNLVSRRFVEISVVIAMIALAVGDAIGISPRASATIAATAAVLHAARLQGWRPFSAVREPIVWILHVGYAWLPIGLALKAAWLFGGFAWAAKWQHAITIGVFATMILAVMTRASLGHTGRPLAVSRWTTVSYVLLTISALLRVFGGALAPERYALAMSVAGTAWVASLVLYLVVYVPILIGPRVDGKPG